MLALVLLAGGGRRRRDEPAPDRGRDSFGVPFATGSSSPAWPLPSSSSRSVSADFGDPRPSRRDEGEEPTRHHAGEDLRAPAGTVVVATEPGRVVFVDLDWGSAANHTAMVLVALDSGIVINLGELDPKSVRVAKGDRVDRGEQIGKVGNTAQLHFETYRAGTTRSHQWTWGAAPPAQLLDPTEYLRAAGSE